MNNESNKLLVTFINIDENTLQFVFTYENTLNTNLQIQNNYIDQSKKTTLVNVKVAYIRPKYDNLEIWSSDTNNVYIARANSVFINKIRYPKQSSIWSNIYKVGKDGNIHEVIDKYSVYIRNKIKTENLYDELDKLRGKKLGCWCVDRCVSTFPDQSKMICHGQVLMQILEETKNQKKLI